jgi:hypothetical protein
VAPIGNGYAHNEIPADRLTSEGGRAMYDVVAMRWPLMMNRAGVAIQPRQLGVEPVGVYANRMYLGGVSMLRNVRAHEVASVRRLSRSEEYSRYGRIHDGGALEIVWRNSAIGAR